MEIEGVFNIPFRDTVNKSYYKSDKVLKTFLR